MRHSLSTYLISLILVIVAQAVAAQIDWENPKYAYAKAYVYNPSEYASDPIIMSDSLHASVIKSTEVELSEHQALKAISVVTGANSGDRDEKAFCYIPHHGIVFYDLDNRPIGHISICFYCGRKEVSPFFESPDKGLLILEELIKDLGHPIFKNPDGYVGFAESKK